MKKKFILLATMAILPLLAFSQASPQHDMHVKMGSETVTWDAAYKNWVPGSGKAFYEGLDAEAAENENFFISRIKPRERFTFAQTQVRPSQNTQRKLLWWCPIGGDGWNALPSYYFGGEVWGMWSYTDIWGNWTAPFVTIPAAMLDICHKNGVQISCCAPVKFGISITPSSDGIGKLLGQMLSDKGGHEKFLKYLQYYGVDGIGFNSEFTWSGSVSGGNYSGQAFGRAMQAFLGDCYTDANKYGVPFHNCWYSLTNSNGNMGGDAALTKENKDWFHYNNKPTSSVYFMNYGGSISTSQETVSTYFPTRSSFDVFMGVDYQAGGNLSNWTRLKDYDISLGLWGAHNRNQIYETRGERGSDPVQQQKTYQMILENVFTGSTNNPVNPPAINNTTRFNSSSANAYGWAQFIAEKSSLTCEDLAKDPFVTYFNLGNGKFFNIEGEKMVDTDWYNIGMQDYLPTWRWWFTKSYMGRTAAEVSSDLKAEFIWDDAWFGGSCLQISGKTDATYTQLFKTKYNTAVSGDNISIRYKVLSGTGSLAWACSVESDPSKEVMATIKNNAGVTGEWVDLVTPIGSGRNGLKIHNDVLALIGLKFTNTSSDFKILLGEMSVTRGKSYAAPAQPEVKKSRIILCNYKGVDMKIIYNMASDKTAPVYNNDVNTWFFKVYTQQEGQDKVMFTATTSWAAYVVGAPYDDKLGGKIRIGVSSVSLDGKNESPISWGEWQTLPAPTILEGTTIDKPIIKANEKFTISFVDPNHPVSKWEVIKSATGETVYTENTLKLNISLPEEGSYDIKITNTGGAVSFTRGIIQISPESTGAIPVIADLTSDKSAAKTDEVINLTYTAGRLGEGKVSRAVKVADPNLLRFPEVVSSRPYTYMMWFKVEKFTHSNQGTNLIDKRSFKNGWPHNNWGDFWITIRPECDGRKETGSCEGGTCTYVDKKHPANEISFNTYGWSEHDFPCTQMMSNDYSVNLDQWTHVAVTCDATNTQKMYFNGKLVAGPYKLLHDKNNGVSYGGCPVYVGGTSTYKSGFNGWVDEFQVWDRVLSDVEVQEAMKGYDTAPTGLIGYWTFEDVATDGDGKKVFPNKGTKGASYQAKYISTLGQKGENTSEIVETTLEASNDELGNPAISGTYEVKTTSEWALPDASSVTENGNKAAVSYAAAGTYTAGLTLKNMWGNDKKDLIDYVVVDDPNGIEESTVEVMGVYPNPFTDFVNIMFTEGGKYTAQIVALDGKLIETKELNVSGGEGVRVDVNGGKGSYVLRILNENGTAVRTVKIIKK